jgi:hypothetical protein
MFRIVDLPLSWNHICGWVKNISSDRIFISWLLFGKKHKYLKKVLHVKIY